VAESVQPPSKDFDLGWLSIEHLHVGDGRRFLAASHETSVGDGSVDRRSAGGQTRGKVVIN
jgi:hypothetical protein